MDEPPGKGQATELFVRHFADAQREVLRYILALVPDVDDAHEVLQETAVALWKKFDHYEPGQPFVPWACRFALHHALKHREKVARRGKVLSLDSMEVLAVERREADDVLERRRRALAECLNGLGDAERALVEQRYGQRTTVALLAEVTGQKASALYKSLERVRRRLFECVNRRLEPGDLT